MGDERERERERESTFFSLKNVIMWSIREIGVEKKRER